MKGIWVSLACAAVLVCASCSGPSVRVNSTGEVHEGIIRAVPMPEDVPDRCAVGHVIYRDKGEGCLVFATMTLDEETYHPLDIRPVILRHSSQGWQMTEFNFEPFDGGSNWVYVGDASGAGKIWAIAEWHVEGPGWTLEVVFSPDGGITWEHIASVEKVHWQSDFVAFDMDALGHGTLTIRGPNEYPPIPDVPYGLYTYRTGDWGRTWSRPTFAQETSIIDPSAWLNGDSYLYLSEEQAMAKTREIMRNLAE